MVMLPLSVIFGTILENLNHISLVNRAVQFRVEFKTSRHADSGSVVRYLL